MSGVGKTLTRSKRVPLTSKYVGSGFYGHLLILRWPAETVSQTSLAFIFLARVKTVTSLTVLIHSTGLFWHKLRLFFFLPPIISQIVRVIWDFDTNSEKWPWAWGKPWLVIVEWESNRVISSASCPEDRLQYFQTSTIYQIVEARILSIFIEY